MIKESGVTGWNEQVHPSQVEGRGRGVTSEGRDKGYLNRDGLVFDGDI